jgi:hypothetical protein
LLESGLCAVPIEESKGLARKILLDLYPISPMGTARAQSTDCVLRPALALLPAAERIN